MINCPMIKYTYTQSIPCIANNTKKLYAFFPTVGNNFIYNRPSGRSNDSYIYISCITITGGEFDIYNDGTDPDGGIISQDMKLVKVGDDIAVTTFHTFKSSHAADGNKFYRTNLYSFGSITLKENATYGLDMDIIASIPTGLYLVARLELYLFI